ncbi:hypothetical protein MPNT_310012 [Candidatus Methylacidithermus pantelleriae]|uniref:Uncharacterized protein n=1 Tax=Candidatus Methylacidithermus pantelleriae TaxID=2744239 RepID=A0A8J2BQS3_9BACT|nr:hypothetical protein MPNT_310012 [Candidatus Methylacidithermus pantelleriae]
MDREVLSSSPPACDLDPPSTFRSAYPPNEIRNLDGIRKPSDLNEQNYPPSLCHGSICFLSS